MVLGKFTPCRGHAPVSYRLHDYSRRHLSLLPALHSLLRRCSALAHGGHHLEDSYRHHHTGRRLRCGDGRRLGTNVTLVFLGVFAIGSALAGLGGVIAGPFLGTNPGMGFDILMDAFVVIVIGGFGSLLGALVASLMIGVLQSYGVLILPKFALVFQFILMALVLIVRPTGLFGDKE